MNSDAEMLQAMEHLADQIDRLAAMLDECVTLTRAGVPISATQSIGMRGAGAVDTRAGGAARNTRALLGAHRQDGRAVMFIHPAPSCRVLAHERRQALKRAASFWEPDPGRPE